MLSVANEELMPDLRLLATSEVHGIIGVCHAEGLAFVYEHETETGTFGRKKGKASRGWKVTEEILLSTHPEMKRSGRWRHTLYERSRQKEKVSSSYNNLLDRPAI